MRKKGNLKQIIIKMNKKVNLRVPRVNPQCSKGGVPQPCFDPIIFKEHLIINFNGT